jgi:hypothetical protein
LQAPFGANLLVSGYTAPALSAVASAASTASARRRFDAMIRARCSAVFGPVEHPPARFHKRSDFVGEFGTP